jgi:hypothetical protein
MANNPVDHIDPLGLWRLLFAIAPGGGTTGGESIAGSAYIGALSDAYMVDALGQEAYARINETRHSCVRDEYECAVSIGKRREPRFYYAIRDYVYGC